MDHLELFTDGGAIRIGDQFYGSSAYVIKFKNRYFKFSNPVEKGTNNLYELKSIRDGLRTIVSNWKALTNIEVWIVSDSQYSISCISEWFDGWKKVGKKYYNKSGKEVANIDLILEIREILQYIPHYRFIKIKSHIEIDIEKTYIDFKRKNNLNITLNEYLLMVRFNELVDGQIRKAFNMKRKEIAERNGLNVV